MRTIMLRRSLGALALRWLGALALSLCAAAASAGPMSAPEGVITDVSAKILLLLRDASSYYDKDPERLHSQVDALLAPISDYDAIAKGVMGVHYKSATEAQRKRFVGVFRLALVKTYARATLQYANSKMELVPSDHSAAATDRFTVKMQVTASDGQAYPLDYAMVKSADGTWRVRNVIVNGVNLGLTYRNQFDSAMMAAASHGNIDKVIDGWTSVVVPKSPTTAGSAAESPSGVPVTAAVPKAGGPGKSQAKKL